MKEDTITILSKYVNSLEVENKKELDSLMKSLYTESLTVEHFNDYNRDEIEDRTKNYIS